MDVRDITPVVLTCDEAPNIARTLSPLAWAEDVVIVDSGSTDDTIAIATGHRNVRVLYRPLDSLARQWEFAVEQARTAWVLTLDADYVVSRELVLELSRLDPTPSVAAYEATFTYAVGGRPIRASLYPPRAVLLRRERCRFWQDGHTQRVRVTGEVKALQARIVHDDRKSFRRFLARQRRYMRREAEKLDTTPYRDLGPAGRLRKLIVVAPWAVLVHTLFVKGLILDGWGGMRYALERWLAELVLSGEMLRRLTKRDHPEAAQ